MKSLWVMLWGYKKRRLVSYSIWRVDVRLYSRIGLVCSFHHRRQQHPRCGSLSGRMNRGHGGTEQVLCADQSEGQTTKRCDQRERSLEFSEVRDLSRGFRRRRPRT